MPSIVTASSPAHFLALVPRLLGFTPRRSLVLVPLAGRSSLGVMRIDLTPTAEAAETSRVASDVIGLVCRIAEADGFATVVYTDAPLHEAGAPVLSHNALASALVARADACGLRVVHLLCVARGGWGSYRDPGTAHALAELRAAPEGTPLPAARRGDQTSGARLPRVGAAERERVAQALAGVETAAALIHGATTDAPSPTRIDPLAIAALGALDDLPLFYEHALAWDPARLDPYAAATLAWCLSRPPLRDVALVGWVDGPDAADAAVDAQIRWQAGAEYPPSIGARLWGDGPRPDAARLLHALELTRRVAASAPTRTRAGAFATSAWLSWALGRSTHAGIYVERARRIERDQGLAGIVASFVEMNHLPDWAFRPSPVT